jgi:arginase
MMDVTLLGVPSAAGAYGAGVARAPRALREAGLVGRLEAAGLTVGDHGDLPLVPFAPDPARPTAQNLARVVDVARSVADKVEAAMAQRTVPLIAGGDCTLTLGVVSGVLRRRPDAALAYLDGDADVSTPSTTRSGILDAMGVAHLLGFEDAAPSLAAIGGRVPLLAGRRLAMIGFDDAELEESAERRLMAERVVLIPARVVQGRGGQAAADALTALADRDGLIVHFDVDVIDSTELPLAQYPHFNVGLPFIDAMAALTTLCGATDVAAIVVTEVNPDNDPDGGHVARLVDGLAQAIGQLAS